MQETLEADIDQHVAGLDMAELMGDDPLQLVAVQLAVPVLVELLKSLRGAGQFLRRQLAVVIGVHGPDHAVVARGRQGGEVRCQCWLGRGQGALSRTLHTREDRFLDAQRCSGRGTAVSGRGHRKQPEACRSRDERQQPARTRCGARSPMADSSTLSLRSLARAVPGSLDAVALLSRVVYCG